MISNDNIAKLLPASEVASVAKTAKEETIEIGIAKAINLSANTGSRVTKWIGQMSDAIINKLEANGYIVKIIKDCNNECVDFVYQIINNAVPTSPPTGGGDKSNDNVRYTIEKFTSDDVTTYKLKQILNDESSYVGDIVSFSASDITLNGKRWNNVETALNSLYEQSEKTYNFTTFTDLNIVTKDKTLTVILKEVLSKGLPVNTIITGQIYKPAAPTLGFNNAEAKIQITVGANGQVYWGTVTSNDVFPYSWNCIYAQNSSSVDMILDWSPTYYILPVATNNTLGGIKVGDGLKIENEKLIADNIDDNVESSSKTWSSNKIKQTLGDEIKKYHADLDYIASMTGVALDELSNFEKIKQYYDSGLWNKQRVYNMVLKSIITETQYTEITGEQFI